MKTVTLREANNRLATLAREVEAREMIFVTRNGRPVLDLVPNKERGGLNFASGEVYLRSKGIENPVPFIGEDFDSPLPEDFLQARKSGTERPQRGVPLTSSCARERYRMAETPGRLGEQQRVEPGPSGRANGCQPAD
jgi:prevent-host-death family protein